MPVPLHPGQHVDQRQLDVGEQPRCRRGSPARCRARSARSVDGVRLRHRRRSTAVESPSRSKDSWSARAARRRSARGGGSAGSGRRGRRTAGPDGTGTPTAPCRRPARRAASRGPASASSGPFASCSALGRAGSASQPASATSSSGVIVGRRRSRRHAPPSASPRRRATRVDLTGAAGPLPDDVDSPARSARRRARPASRPPRRLRAGRPSTSGRRRRSRGSSAESVSNSRSRSTRNSRLSKTWCTSSRSHGRAAVSATVALQLEVADQGVDPAVADHVGQVLPQRVAGLARDLVDPGDDLLEGPELVDPLRGGLRADPGHARQVVAGLPHHRRQVGIVRRRRRRSAGRHRCRRHPGQLGDARASGTGPCSGR